ncbi:hypothetical protein Tco_0014165 [Tanacetum coccineum]
MTTLEFGFVQQVHNISSCYNIPIPSPISLISILQPWAVTPEVTLNSTLKASDASWICPLGSLVVAVVVVVVIIVSSSRSAFTVTGRMVNIFAVSALLSTWPIVVIIALGT